MIFVMRGKAYGQGERLKREKEFRRNGLYNAGLKVYLCTRSKPQKAVFDEKMWVKKIRGYGPTKRGWKRVEWRHRDIKGSRHRYTEALTKNLRFLSGWPNGQVVALTNLLRSFSGLLRKAVAPT
jgi:hypothetical protein